MDELVFWGNQTIEEWVEGGSLVTTIYPDRTRVTVFVPDEEDDNGSV